MNKLINFATFCIVVLVTVAAFAQKPAGRPGFHQAVHAGKVSSVSREKLIRFREPRLTPPGVRPPEYKGGAFLGGGEWRWHRNYGWMLLPVGTSNTVLLPETFVLPPTVTAYEVPQVERSVTVVCPTCGVPFVVQLPQ